MRRCTAVLVWLSTFLLAMVSLPLSVQAGASAPERTYAILVCGGSKKSSNHLRFWGDMALTYCLLRRDVGVPKENIRLLWASGDPSQDICLAQSKCASCGSRSLLPLNPSDFDRDGVGDVDGAATYAGVEAAFSEIGSRLTADDQLFVYFTDHGTKSMPEAIVDSIIEPFSSIKLWNGELLPDWMIGTWTRDLPCPFVVASVCCYSGAIMADVMNSSGIRFVTTASEYVQSHAGNTMPWFCKWTYEFVSALRGYYPASGAEPHVRGKDCQADADGDGRTSLREAARHACRRRADNDYPQYSESWCGCGGGLFPEATMTAGEQHDSAARHAAEWRGYLGFRRMYALNLKGGASSPEADGRDEMDQETLTVSAPPTSVGKNGAEQVFQRWTVTPSSASLGEKFDVTSPETVFVMPASSLTLTPKYRDVSKGCSVTLFAQTDRPDIPSEGLFTWSPDGKTWYRAGQSAVLDAGTLQLRWRSSSAAWKAPSGKTKVKLADGESYDNGRNPAVFAYVPSVSVGMKVWRETGWTESSAGGKVTSSPSSSRVAVGKKVTLTAKAARGYVFSHWESDDVEIASPQSKKLSFAQPGDDVRVTACFVTAEHDAASIALSVDGVSLLPGEDGLLPTNVMCGVALNWPLVRSADSATTVTASGLPSGLSLKRDKALDAYAIVGVPSSASKTNKKTSSVTPSKVKLTVKTDGKASKVFRLDMTVLPLPVWAKGSFGGLACADEFGRGVGAASMTVSASGKISGKFSLFGTNWTYSATGYSAFADSEIETNRFFRLECQAKASKVKRNLAVEVRSGWLSELSDDRLSCSRAEGLFELGGLMMRRDVWKDAAIGIDPSCDRRSLSAIGQPEASMKVSKKGVAQFSGRLDDGTGLSVSSTAFVDEDEMLRTWLIVPATKKYAGYCDLIEIKATKEDHGNE